MQNIPEIMAAHRLRMTQPRRGVFELLQNAQEPLSIRDLCEQLPWINRTSIYRTLELFEQLHIITVVHVGWKKRYELAGTYQRHHHHHLICTQCGSITEINSKRLEMVIHNLTVAHAFTPTGHTFEITGLCAHCRTNKLDNKL